MPHPIMFDGDDPALAEVRTIALGFPSAFEKLSWGRPAFCAPKMFAVYGGSVKGSAEGGVKGGADNEYVQFPQSVLVKVDDNERTALEQDPRFFYPAYLGPFGWLGLDLTAPKVDWAEVAELVDASFRLVAPGKSIRQLDER